MKTVFIKVIFWKVKTATVFETDGLEPFPFQSRHLADGVFDD
jgi:hypothetical protein